MRATWASPCWGPFISTSLERQVDPSPLGVSDHKRDQNQVLTSLTELVGLRLAPVLWNRWVMGVSLLSQGQTLTPTVLTLSAMPGQKLTLTGHA